MMWASYLRQINIEFVSSTDGSFRGDSARCGHQGAIARAGEGLGAESECRRARQQGHRTSRTSGPAFRWIFV